MRQNLFSRLFCLTILIVLAPAGAADSAAFEQVKTKTFDKEKFVFPDDFRGTRLNVVFLSMSDDQDNGTLQQEALLDWHAELEQRSTFSAEVMAYHFPVMAGVPFFVKGIITGAMTDSYEGKVPLDQCGALFIKDLEAFAAAAGLVIDEQPTIVIASEDGKPLRSFKGEMSSEGVDEIVAAVAQALQ